MIDSKSQNRDQSNNSCKNIRVDKLKIIDFIKERCSWLSGASLSYFNYILKIHAVLGTIDIILNDSNKILALSLIRHTNSHDILPMNVFVGFGKYIHVDLFIADTDESRNDLCDQIIEKTSDEDRLVFIRNGNKHKVTVCSKHFLRLLKRI